MDLNTPRDPVPNMPDLGQVLGREAAFREFPLVARRQREVQVVMRQSVCNAVSRHGREQTDVEVCGVLVGNVYHDAIGPFVYVEHSIRGEHAGNQMAQVTFTAETWAHIQSVMDETYPNSRVIGWYHTHPGFGIFLSGMDLFIHQNFFNGPEQIALVFDPISGEEGVFVWRNGAAVREVILVEEDEVVDIHRVGVSLRDMPPLCAAGDDLSSRLTRLEQRQRLNEKLLGIAVLVAICWPILLTYWRSSAMPRTAEPTSESRSERRPPVRHTQEDHRATSEETISPRRNAWANDAQNQEGHNEQRE